MCVHQVETLFFAPCKLEPEGTRVCLARGFVSPFRSSIRVRVDHPDERGKYYIAPGIAAPTAGAYNIVLAFLKANCSEPVAFQ
jgi:hypothetical protein